MCTHSLTSTKSLPKNSSQNDRTGCGGHPSSIALVKINSLCQITLNHFKLDNSKWHIFWPSAEWESIERERVCWWFRPSLAAAKSILKIHLTHHPANRWELSQSRNRACVCVCWVNFKRDWAMQRKVLGYSNQFLISKQRTSYPAMTVCPVRPGICPSPRPKTVLSVCKKSPNVYVQCQNVSCVWTVFRFSLLIINVIPPLPPIGSLISLSLFLSIIAKS